MRKLPVWPPVWVSYRRFLFCGEENLAFLSHGIPLQGEGFLQDFPIQAFLLCAREHQSAAVQHHEIVGLLSRHGQVVKHHQEGLFLLLLQRREHLQKRRLVA